MFSANKSSKLTNFPAVIWETTLWEAGEQPVPTTNGCWSGKVASEGTAVWLTTGREAKVELTVMGRLYTVDEQGAENCKLAEENTETTSGTTRNEDVPGKASNCEATSREVDVVEAFRGRDPTAVDDWDAEVMVED